MIRRRSRRNRAAARTRGGPRPAGIQPPRHGTSSLAGRIGSGPLVALALAMSLLALVLCAVLVPGFVMGAEPEDDRARRSGGGRSDVCHRELPIRKSRTGHAPLG